MEWSNARRVGAAEEAGGVTGSGQVGHVLVETLNTKRHSIEMIKCSCCGFECDCMDLYYDHIMFDNRHHEMAQRELSAPKKTRRYSYRGRNSLTIKSSTSQLSSSKQAYGLGASAY
ncbi:hypothetical protein GQ54DRAFT_332893 [Martensiomyces pterosporus]|nr:hypothetical protein GQ54DRAFT_332893 [Martensiomyces pterosporus]